MAQLPQEFLTRMQEMLGDEFDAFLTSYDAPRTAGLRVNTKKCRTEDFPPLVPGTWKKIPWIPNGYFVPDGMRMGQSPLYAAGVFYLQEPSAMTPASRLRVHAADDDFADSRLYDRTGAHLARFQGDIQRTPLQPPVAELFAGFPDRIQFRVGQRVFIRISAVIAPRNHLSLVHNHTADRHFHQLFRFLRLRNRLAHEAFPFFPVRFFLRRFQLCFFFHCALPFFSAYIFCPSRIS